MRQRSRRISTTIFPKRKNNPKAREGQGKISSPEELRRGTDATADDRSAEPELAVEEFFEEEAREAGGVVAKNTVLLEEIVEHDAEAELLHCGKIDGHRFGTLGAVAPGHVGRDGLAISDDPIDDAARDVLLDRAEMIAKGVAGGFTGLGHQIRDIHARSLGSGDGAGDFRDEEIGQNAGVERAGPEKNQVGLPDSFDGPGERADAARGKLEFLDGRAAGGDAGFAVNGAAVFERGDEMNVRKSRWKNAAADGEHFAADADGFGEIAGDMRERGEEKIAEIVAGEAATRVETILEEAAEKGFVFRKSHHAVADIAGREDAVFAAQAAGASAVIGDCDDGCEIGDGAFDAGMFAGVADDEFLEAAEERGKAGAASKSNDAEAAGKSLRFGRAFFHNGFQDFWKEKIPRKRFYTENSEDTEITEKKKTGQAKACPYKNPTKTASAVPTIHAELQTG